MIWGRGSTGGKFRNNSQLRTVAWTDYGLKVEQGMARPPATDASAANESQDMKILLQNSQTKLYFSLLGVWIANPNLAYDFRHSARALDFARANELSDVQLVVKFEDSQWENVIPMPLQVATLSG